MDDGKMTPLLPKPSVCLEDAGEGRNTLGQTANDGKMRLNNKLN